MFRRTLTHKERTQIFLLEFTFVTGDRNSYLLPCKRWGVETKVGARELVKGWTRDQRNGGLHFGVGTQGPYRRPSSRRTLGVSTPGRVGVTGRKVLPTDE